VRRPKLVSLAGADRIEFVVTSLKQSKLDDVGIQQSLHGLCDLLNTSEFKLQIAQAVFKYLPVLSVAIIFVLRHEATAVPPIFSGRPSNPQFAEVRACHLRHAHR
jgi:hypothetical protein